MEYKSESFMCGERGNELVAQGRLDEAVTMYQKAARAAEAEVPPSCLDCGGPEGYWKNWWNAHTSVLEIVLAHELPRLMPRTEIQAHPLRPNFLNPQ